MVTAMPSFYIQQFGCRATQADAAALEAQLRQRGCVDAGDVGAADVVVVNTCTVTTSADAQARDAIRKIHSRNPAAQVIVTGCYAQRAPQDLAALPGVSWVVGNSHKPEIPRILSEWQEGLRAERNFVPAANLHPGTVSSFESGFPSLQHAHPKILTGDIFEQTSLLAAPVLGGEANHTRPILKIQDGCDSRCSYCVIPFVRGRSRSLPPEPVVAEIQRLSDAGYREIVLSGINLGMYGRDLSPQVEFEDLLRRVLDETSVQRLRISSIEPMDVTRDLVALLDSSERFAQHFHMPLQSGSDRILAAMHRWYRAEHYARRIELIREQLPHAAIGADVIAGFPGETQADHEETLAFISRWPFTYLHVFSFSKRPGTKAAARGDEVPGGVIRRRARELRALGEEKSAAFYRAQCGRTLQVLTLRHTRRTDSADSPGSRETRGNSREDSLQGLKPDEQQPLTWELKLPPPNEPPQEPLKESSEELSSKQELLQRLWTPAISSNYLHVRLAGDWPANQMLRARCSSGGTDHLNANAEPETKPVFAV
jgi:threonylcarbamoyladenosine tRNA methylthiotransferase MtaB